MTVFQKRKRIEKALLAAVLSLTAALLLGGCTGKDKDAESRTESTAPSETTEYHFLEEGSPSSEEKESEEGTEEGEIVHVWNDNFLDDFHAVINHPVEKTVAEGEVPTGGRIFIGEGGCTCHGSHMYNDYKKSWNGANGMTAEGREFSAQIVVDPDRVGTQIQDLAPVSGKNGYVAYFYQIKDGKPSGYYLYELDENFQVIQSALAKIDVHDFIHDLMGDAEGNFHVMYNVVGGSNYVIFSAEGEILFEKKVLPYSSFCAFGKGRVALVETVMETMERRFSEADPETGEFLELAVSRDETVKQELMAYDVLEAALIDEYRLVWCASTGVCFYDLSSRERKVVYHWSNHGIVPTRVEDLTVTADGSIGIYYKDANEEGYHYLLLKPTEEKEELKSITVAVDPSNRAVYEKAAAYFQRSYPEYAIEIKDDYDETSLLTQLGAGSGPVLVDTQLTGFEDLVKLWQPLDGFLEQTGLADEMFPEALEFGKIDGVTYAVVRDFQIQTLLVPDFGPSDWDYEGFLKALEDHGGAAFTIRDFRSTTDWRRKYFSVLSNGLLDNYFLDAETGRTIFGTPDFERVLKLSQKAAKCPAAEEGLALREGEVLCECSDVLSMLVALNLRRRLEANGERTIGYPTKDGAKNLLVPLHPLALRSTATDEEKEIAYTFLTVYLSKEVVASSSFLPVRKDVLEEQFKDYQEMVERSIKDGTYQPDLPVLDWDKDVGFLEDLIKNGTVQRSFPPGLQRIFDEEIDAYLSGGIDGKVLDDHLRSRVWLYLEEQK